MCIDVLLQTSMRKKPIIDFLGRNISCSRIKLGGETELIYKSRRRRNGVHFLTFEEELALVFLYVEYNPGTEKYIRHKHTTQLVYIFKWITGRIKSLCCLFLFIQLMKFFFWLHGFWDLSSPNGDLMWPSAVKAPWPNHWTAREFPPVLFRCQWVHLND